MAQEKITAAEEEYNERVHFAEEIRKTDADLADDLIASAETAKNEKIKLAQEEHVGLLEELGSTYPELSRIVDLETGKQKGFWEQLFGGITTSNKKEIDAVKKDYGMLADDTETAAGRMAKGLNTQVGTAWGDVKKATKDYEKEVKDAKGKVEDFSKKASSSLDKPYKSTRKLKDEINALPTKKTIDITINEKTRKSTQVVGSSGPSGRSSDLSRSIYDLYDNGIAPLYDLPATLASGFTGDAGRENIGHEDNKLNKLVEELSAKLSKLIDAVGQEKVGNVYLDKRDLVGSIKYEMSKALVKKGV